MMSVFFFRSTDDDFNESNERMQKACHPFGTKLNVKDGLLVVEIT